MPQIKIKFDNNLTQTPIIVPLATPTPEENNGGPITTSTKSETKQTAIYGTKVPLISINGVVVPFEDVESMMLDLSGMTPFATLTIRDSQKIIRGLNTPSSDNIVRLQILPRFDGAYKKIDLTMYASGVDSQGDLMTFHCYYKLQALREGRIKCFGETTTYDVLEKIARECSLGFASNVPDSNDTRLLYCANRSYLDFMGDVIKTSGASGTDITSKVKYEAWIDPWNNLNFVDEYERFTSVDTADEMMIYVAETKGDATPGSIDESSLSQRVAIISNNITQAENELYIKRYEIDNNSTVMQGVDNIVTSYNMVDDALHESHLIDGDQKTEIIPSFKYLGENYSEFDYLTASRCREKMNDKMSCERLKVEVHSPLLCLPRGSKVNLLWMETDSKLQNIKERIGVDENDVKSNIEIPDEDVHNTEHNEPRINRQITGQYYIQSNILFYNKVGKWVNRLYLTRPRDQKFNYLDVTEGLEEKTI